VTRATSTCSDRRERGGRCRASPCADGYQRPERLNVRGHEILPVRGHRTSPRATPELVARSARSESLDPGPTGRAGVRGASHWCPEARSRPVGERSSSSSSAPVCRRSVRHRHAPAPRLPGHGRSIGAGGCFGDGASPGLGRALCVDARLQAADGRGRGDGSSGGLDSRSWCALEVRPVGGSLV
jgi:hypothetical protein